MASATRICKVCGKEYPYCQTLRQVAGIFRWQDVACSPAHGSTYLARVRAARGEIDEEPAVHNDIPEYLEDEEEDEYNALFEEDDDCDEDDE